MKKKTPTALAQYRQGDVLLERIEKLPRGLKKAPLVNNRLQIAVGKSAGGKAHILDDPGGQILLDRDGNRFVKVKGIRMNFTAPVAPAGSSEWIINLVNIGPVRFRVGDVKLLSDLKAQVKGSFGFLVHAGADPDHDKIAIPQGFYASPAQRESRNEDIQNVQD